MPKGKIIIHATLDPGHLNKDVRVQIGLVGDAGLTISRHLSIPVTTGDSYTVAVAVEAVGHHILVGLGEVVREVQAASGAGDARLGVDDDVRLD